jgi:hypothetical protein
MSRFSNASWISSVRKLQILRQFRFGRLVMLVKPTRLSEELSLSGSLRAVLNPKLRDISMVYYGIRREFEHGNLWIDGQVK